MKKINGKMKTFEETVMKKPKEFSKPGVEKFYFLEPKKHFKSELFSFFELRKCYLLKYKKFSWGYLFLKHKKSFLLRNYKKFFIA